MPHITVSAGILRIRYHVQGRGAVSVVHDPEDRVAVVTVGDDEFAVPCDNPRFVLTELERLGPVPAEVAAAVMRLADNAILLPATNGAASVSVRSRPLSIVATFFDSDGRLVGELSAGSIPALEAAAGGNVTIPDEARRILRHWTSTEPFWFMAVYCLMPLLASLAISLHPHAMEPWRVLALSMGASLSAVGGLLSGLRGRAVWRTPLA
jgi:hypothetical protein